MTIFDIHILSNYAQWFGSFLIFLIAFFFTKKRSFEIIIIGVYGLNSIVFQLAQTIMHYYKLRDFPNIVANVYVLSETLILFILFSYLLKSYIPKRIFILIGIAYTAFFAVAFSSQMTVIFSSIRAVRDVSLILCSIIYFFYLLRELPEEKLTELPMFWANSAILFFFSCTFMLSLSLTYLTGVLKDNLTEVWAFRNFLRFIFCLIICYGIWKSRRHINTTTSV